MQLINSLINVCYPIKEKKIKYIKQDDKKLIIVVTGKANKILDK